MSHLIFDEQSIEKIIIGSKILEFGILKTTKNLRIKFEDAKGVIHCVELDFDETGMWIDNES